MRFRHFSQVRRFPHSWFAIGLAFLSSSLLQAQTLLVKPYVQPGDESALSATDEKVIAWVTDQIEADFEVRYGTSPACDKTARPTRAALNLAADQKYFTYAATLSTLPLNTNIHYRVAVQGRVCREGFFQTRKSPENPTQFVVVGDLAAGGKDAGKIPFEIWRTWPELLVVVGDIVYSNGRFSEYLDHFWNELNNVELRSPTTGAPLLKGVPLYAVVGNHDVIRRTWTKYPDQLAAFYFFRAPRNGPKDVSGFAPLSGPEEQVSAFRAAAEPNYPALCFYSFDHGPAHFLCLDANKYVNVNDPALRRWIKEDLSRSRARWKLVFFHQAAFHSSAKHVAEQKMRLLSPLFEECGVDLVFSGHVHNYQRSKPLRFKPTHALTTEEKFLVRGRFTIDRRFDGIRKTRPRGIVYIVTGGGGARLVDGTSPPPSERGKRDRMNWKPFTAKLISDRHSFTHVRIEQERLTLRQIDENGIEVDRIYISKAAN